MNYLEILSKAEYKLKQFDYIILDIRKCIAAGSTGGEIASILGHYLKNLRTTNEVAYTIMQTDIEKYLADCKKGGLTII